MLAISVSNLRQTLATAAVALSVLALAACGGSDDDGATTGSATASGAGDSLAEARAGVERMSQAPTSIGIDEPLDALPEGKTVYILQCGPPVCKTIADGAEEALELLGAEVERLDAGITPEEITAAWEETARAAPDGIVFMATPVAMIERYLRELGERDGIPIVSNGSDQANGPGHLFEVNPPANFERAGATLADWVAVNTEGEGRAVLFDIPDYTVFKPLVGAFQQRLGEVCPGCESEVVEVRATDIGTELPGRVVSYLQQNPDTDYVVPSFGDMALGVPEALASAGIEGVRLASINGTKVNHQEIAAGGVQDADVAQNNEMIGWKEADALARAMTGQGIDADTAELVPAQLLTAETIDFDPAGGLYTAPADFKEQFKALWGLD